MKTLIDGRTKILGIIADPVAQAKTPAMANALLQQCGLFGAFALLPMHVNAEDLTEFLAALRRLKNFRGAVISMPHKQSIANLVDELTPEARLVGAVNVIRADAGRLRGTVLDGEGFVSGLTTAGRNVENTHVYIAGAGGAASAIAFAVAKYGCASLCIDNRSPDRARSLAERIGRRYPSVEIATKVSTTMKFDIAINCTPLGMKPDDALPIADAVIERSALVADCIVAPEMTRLLEVAVGRDKAIHTGTPMLAAQMRLMLKFMGVELPPAP